MPLDPQNRAHLGLSMVDFSAMGISGGLDTRMTRLLYVDVGGFFTGSAEPDFSGDPSSDPESWIAIRHCLYVAPGIRIPHRYGPTWTWDLTARGGFGSLWNLDGSQYPDVAQMQSDVALITGAEFLVRWQQYGLRASGKGFFFSPFSRVVLDEIAMVRSQVALEALIQW